MLHIYLIHINRNCMMVSDVIFLHLWIRRIHPMYIVSIADHLQVNVKKNIIIVFSRYLLILFIFYLFIYSFLYLFFRFTWEVTWLWPSDRKRCHPYVDGLLDLPAATDQVESASWGPARVLQRSSTASNNNDW